MTDLIRGIGRRTRTARGRYLPLTAAALCMAAVMLFSVPVSADESVSEPESVAQDKLSGDPRKDTVTIARAQIGYTETRSSGRQLSYFGSWASEDQASTGAPWCSEFASWCVRESGVPAKFYPKCTSVDEAREYQGSLDRVFALSGGNENSKSWIGSYYVGSIELSDVEPGDIVLVRKSDTSASSPNHTALVEKVDVQEGIIHTIDGNVGGTPRRVKRRKYTPEHIYAVIKPLYELSPISGLTAFDADGNCITLHWDEREKADGYYISRSKSQDGDYKQIARISSSSRTYYYDYDIKDGKKYYYKVIPYLKTAGGQTFDGAAWLKQAEENGEKICVSALSHDERSPEGDQ